MKKSFIDKVRERIGVAPTKKRALQNKKDAQHKIVEARLKKAKALKTSASKIRTMNPEKTTPMTEKEKEFLGTLSSVTYNKPSK